MTDADLTPREILRRLDEHVVGQTKAKRAVAVALRNRWRRRQLPADLASDVYPKNILLMGPTGVGKTEIARRLAHLARAPFIKVEASKFSEVGYHGRDVESMIRDLVDASIALVRQEKAIEVREAAADAAEARLADALCFDRGLTPPPPADLPVGGVMMVEEGGIWRPQPVGEAEAGDPIEAEAQRQAFEQTRTGLIEELRNGSLDREVIEIELLDNSSPTLNITGPQGNDAMGIDAAALQELWGRNPGQKTKIRKLTVAEAREALVDEEADKLIDHDAIQREAVDRAQSDGIIFLDEVDKIIGSGGGDGPDVSREGVQRDLLPIVEGSTVYTKSGYVKTDHVLFIAAGAFHFHKPSELIPELQGRFPVRVALKALGEEDFVRILTEPKNSLCRQYRSLFETEDVTLTFKEGGVRRLAELAFQQNRTTQNIGARRLMTILERCLEDLSFEASEMGGQEVVVDVPFVDERLGSHGDDEDLIQYDV